MHSVVGAMTSISILEPLTTRLKIYIITGVFNSSLNAMFLMFLVLVTMVK